MLQRKTTQEGPYDLMRRRAVDAVWPPVPLTTNAMMLHPRILLAAAVNEMCESAGGRLA